MESPTPPADACASGSFSSSTRAPSSVAEADAGPGRAGEVIGDDRGERGRAGLGCRSRLRRSRSCRPVDLLYVRPARRATSRPRSTEPALFRAVEPRVRPSSCSVVLRRADRPAPTRSTTPREGIRVRPRTADGRASMSRPSRSATPADNGLLFVPAEAPTTGVIDSRSPDRRPPRSSLLQGRLNLANSPLYGTVVMAERGDDAIPDGLVAGAGGFEGDLVGGLSPWIRPPPETT